MGTEGVRAWLICQYPGWPPLSKIMQMSYRDYAYFVQIHHEYDTSKQFVRVPQPIFSCQLGNPTSDQCQYQDLSCAKEKNKN